MAHGKEHQLTLSHQQLNEAAEKAAKRIQARFPGNEPFNVYPIPRGGVPAAYLLGTYLQINLVEHPGDADLLFDDLIDSGGTEAKWRTLYPHKPFFALFDKRVDDPGWIVFPWETSDRSNDDTIVGTITNRLREHGISFRANENIAAHLLPGEPELLRAEVARRSRSLLESLIIDVDNDHNTEGTAERMSKMYCEEVCRGRFTPPPKITTFPNHAAFDELIVSGPISIRSLCSHHTCPILGKCWIGIIPGERVAGLSKYNRVVQWYAARPQIQEELVVQIADHLEEELKPKGLAVVITAQHTCMTWRGVQEHHEAAMTTSVMRGVFREKEAARAEFLAFLPKV